MKKQIKVSELIKQLNSATAHIVGGYTPDELHKDVFNSTNKILNEYGLNASTWGVSISANVDDVEFTIAHDRLISYDLDKEDYKNRRYATKWKVVRVSYLMPEVCGENDTIELLIQKAVDKKMSENINAWESHIAIAEKELQENKIKLAELINKRTEYIRNIPVV